MSPQESEAPYRSLRQAWWMVSVFCFAGLISYTDRLILGVLVDPIRRTLGISDSQVSLLQGAAFAAVYVTAGLIMGRLADRTRRVMLIRAGALLWCLGTVACGLAPTFWSLFATRLLVGVGEAALAPAAVSMIADSFPPARRGLAIGIFVMGTVVGGPAAIAIGGTVLGAAEAGAFSAIPGIGALAPWRMVLVLIGIAGLLLPLVCLSVREPERREMSGGTLSLRHVAGRLVSGRRILFPLYLGMALLCIGDYGLLSWMPTVLSRRHLLGPTQIGLAFGAVTAVAGVVGSVIGGMFSDRAQRLGGTRARVYLAGVFALLASASGILASAPGPSLALAGLAVWTFASAVAAISGIAALQVIIANEYRGVGMSLVAFFNTLLGLGFGPTMVALATERIYRDPTAVGFSITTVVVPAGLISAALFMLSRKAFLQNAGGGPGKEELS